MKIYCEQILKCKHCPHFGWFVELYPYCYKAKRRINGKGIGRGYYDERIALIPAWCPLPTDAEIVRFRKALEFYADWENYKYRTEEAGEFFGKDTSNAIIDDFGKIAREVLMLEKEENNVNRKA